MKMISALAQADLRSLHPVLLVITEFVTQDFVAL